MADAHRLADGFKRAIDAQMRYYRALGDVTTEYVKSLIGIWADAKLPLDLGAFRRTAGGQAAPAPAVAGQAVAARTPALVLEAELGQQARGVFMVENKLPRHVATRVEASAFIGPEGRETSPALEIEPDVISLGPGAKTLVHIVAVIGEDLRDGASYRGEISVPGLSESRVPVVIRRRASAHAAPIVPPAVAPVVPPLVDVPKKPPSGGSGSAATGGHAGGSAPR